MLSILMQVLVGLIAGYIASRIMKLKGGVVKYIAIGIVGSILGNILISLIGFYAIGFFANIIVSIAGACLLISISRKVL